MRVDTISSRIAIASFALAIAGCFEAPAERSNETEIIVGPTGGTFEVSGAELEFPEGAVDREVTITAVHIAMPDGVPGTPVGLAYLFEPEGTQFLKPVLMRLPIDASVGAPLDLKVATASKGDSTFSLLSAAVNGSTAEAKTLHFSMFVPTVVVAEDGGTSEDAGTGGDDGGSVPEFPDCPVSSDAGAGMTCGKLFADIGQSMTGTEGMLLTRVCVVNGQAINQTVYCAAWSSDCECDGVDAIRPFPRPIYDAGTNLYALLHSLWTCACGFENVPLGQPVCAATLGDPPSSSGLFESATGARCADGTTCEYGDCVNTNHGYICSVECLQGCPCANLHCGQLPGAPPYLCFPLF